MEKNKEFLHFVENYKSEKNEKLINTIIEAFNVLTDGHPILAITETTNDITSDAVQEADVQPEPVEQTTEVNSTNNASNTKEIETVNPELIEKIRDTCKKITEIYKFLTGESYKIDESKSSSEISNEKEEPKKMDDPEPENIPKTPVMEEVTIDPAETESEGSAQNEPESQTRTPTFSFNNVKNTKDSILKYMNSIYEINSTEPVDKIIENTIPLIDDLIIKSNAEISDLANNNMYHYANVIYLTLSNDIAEWLYILKTFDVNINQANNMKDVHGRDIVKFFNENIYSKANTYIDMIKNLLQNETAETNNANLNSILDKINELSAILEYR